MSQENVEIVGKANAAWNTSGVDAILPFCPEDVVWYPFPEWPDGAYARTGHDGVREIMDTWTKNFDEWTSAVEEIRDLGDRVLVLGEIAGRTKGSGVPIRQQAAWVCSGFRGGQIGEVHFFLTWKEALEAVGLSE
jgi:ketosteroid isomerase-like protein